MPSKISYFRTEHFLETADFNASGSKCTIDGLGFKKGDTFGHQETERVIIICNQYKDSDLNTLLVKGEDSLTIWVEEKSPTSSKPQNYQTSAVEQQSLTNPQPLPTKTVVKKYRGQEYEETVVDWAAIQQMNHQKPRRKYRGQYID